MSVDSALGRLAGAWHPRAARPEDSLWQRLFPARLPHRTSSPAAHAPALVVVASANRIEAPAFRDGRVIDGPNDPHRRYRLEHARPTDMAALDAVLKETAPRVLLIDVELCAWLGLGGVRTLRRNHAAVDWLLAWPQASPRWIETAIHAQASGAVPWSADRSELARALDAVLAGELWFPRRVMTWLYTSMLLAARSDGPLSLPGESAGAALTAREVEVMALMRQGLTNKQIADRLDISVNTVKKHLASSFEKRGLRSRRQAQG